MSDILERSGIHYLNGRPWCLPMHPVEAERIHQCPGSSGHHVIEKKVHLFIPLLGKLKGTDITTNAICTVVKTYAEKAGIEVNGIRFDGVRATAVTNAFEHEAVIAEVQAGLIPANVSTTNLYDHVITGRMNRPRIR